MQIYKDTYKDYYVWELYNMFRDQFYTYPKQFVDVLEVTDANARVLNLNFYPVEYLSRPVITLFANRTAYESNTWTLLVEQTDYFIDYEMWIVSMVRNISTGNYITVSWQYSMINLRQFVSHLNKWLRYLDKYFPIKSIEEYTKSWTELITQIDLTETPFIDVNWIYQNLDDTRPIKIMRRGKYIIFPPEAITLNMSNWNTLNDYVNRYQTETWGVQWVSLPCYIEGNVKPTQVDWVENIDVMINAKFKFAELGIDALLVYIGIECYKSLMRYSANIPLFTLRLNEKWYMWLIMELKQELATMVWDSSISKWLYHWSSTPVDTVLNANNVN